MAEKNEEVVIITDDADDGALFSHGIDDGAVVAGVIHEKGHGKLAEQASQVWNRAKVGFEKGKLEHDGKGFHEVAEVNEVVVEGPTAAATTANPTAWERLATIPSTVAGSLVSVTLVIRAPRRHFSSRKN